MFLEVPSQPDNPKNILSSVLKGILYGAGAGVLWALLVCIFRRSIRREEDCHKYIHQRCLGAIPFVHTKERSVKTAGGLNVLDINIHNDFKESVRLIRNKLARYARENSCKTILVTSALAGEGKSTVAVNLAISLEQEGKKVALIDCDLRNPSDGEILNFKSDVGLIDYLLNKVSFKECIFTAGDLAHQEIEGPVHRDQIFALVTRVKRKGKWIGTEDFCWKFFEKIWIRLVPYRRMIMRLYKYISFLWRR